MQMTDITIPPAALEAGARVICAGDQWGKPCATPCSDCLPEARAAFLAMLRAWEGMQHDNYVIVLPLTEQTDDKA